MTSHKCDEWTGAPFLQRKAERPWTVPPGEEKAQGRLINVQSAKQGEYLLILERVKAKGKNTS